MERSKKSELLIGVMVGIYGNWLIAIVEKLEKKDLFPIMVFAFSFILFVLYFLEIFTEIEKQHWWKSIPLKIFLGGFYLLLIFVSLWFSGLFASDFLLSLTGITFWYILMQVEKRAFV